MYGYSVSQVESEGSAFANLTNRPVPDGFSASIIPSLLFGSLISATDPGKLEPNYTELLSQQAKALKLSNFSSFSDCAGNFP